MSMYQCTACDRWLDDDWNPMHEGEICPDCAFHAEEMAAERLRREYSLEQDVTARSLREGKK